ncbi:Plasma membrane t-SNARE, secretory vesicle fusion [Gaertneriomyces sp. JEL0708]|nr:Plasma membrane t-SNARE, secretory vesicle fusion [Gaertneriomyces sp. JEL0708]
MSRDRTADLRNGGPRMGATGMDQRNGNGSAYGSNSSLYGRQYSNDNMEMSRYPSSQNTYVGGGSGNGYGNSYAPSGGRGGSDMDRFFGEVEQIQQGIARIQADVRTIDELHRRALQATSPDEQARITRQLDEQQDATNDLIQSLRSSLKIMAKSTKTAPTADRNIRQQQQSGLAQRLMDVAREYQDVQQRSKQRYRQNMERQIRIARPDATREEVEQAVDSNGGSVFSQQLLSSRIGSQRAALAEVQNRHVEIQRIEQSINELFNLFQDMQAMLEQQQETIDAIETNVDTAHVNIEDGNKEMTQAITYRKSSRKKAWWICFCVLILLGVIAILVYIYVIKPSLDNKNNNNNNGTTPA